jgi:catechol 2,3-dioxygenase-like lactoylglutathione lyase family enzyme
MAGTEELVPVAPEFFVRDVASSVAFYQRLGFVVLRQELDFAVMALGKAHVLIASEQLALEKDRVAEGRGAAVHIRIMVDDVDAMRKTVEEVGANVVHEIADRYYGLRDFIIEDPDGFSVRFAAPL